MTNISKPSGRPLKDDAALVHKVTVSLTDDDVQWLDRMRDERDIRPSQSEMLRLAVKKMIEEYKKGIGELGEG